MDPDPQHGTGEKAQYRVLTVRLFNKKKGLGKFLFSGKKKFSDPSSSIVRFLIHEDFHNVMML
jgi:hypothetical protein